MRASAVSARVSAASARDLSVSARDSALTARDSAASIRDLAVLARASAARLGGVGLEDVEHAFARLRIEEVHLLALRPEVEAEGLAAKHHGPVQVLHHRKRLVRAAGEPAPLQIQPQVLPGRVVLEILAHPEPLVELRLAPLVLAPRPSRRHLHREGRHHPFLPQLVDGALVLRHAEHHEHVRRHAGARVAFLVVDEEVRGDVHVRTVPEVVIERGERTENRPELPVVLRQRLAVTARIVDGGGGKGALGHRPAPPCSGARLRGPG